ncbi:hypothetical protein JCM11491_006757 [Sporobolomyces phaffii]
MVDDGSLLPPGSRFAMYLDPREDPPVPSPLHGKLPRPIPPASRSSASPSKSLPLSPKGTTALNGSSSRDKKGRIESLNFPPPTRTQAAIVTHEASERRLKDCYRTPISENGDAPRNSTLEGEKEPVGEILETETVGEWKLGEMLGKGTSGTVYLARSIKDGSFAAVKRVKRLPQNHKVSDSRLCHLASSSTRTRGLKRRLVEQQEAALVHREIALMKLGSPHPHLVELFDVYESRSNLYLVTEYCPLGELFQYVTLNALTYVERCRFYSQLISALLHLSQTSISHRDIKFENLLLYRGDQGNLSLKVADMGMATVQLEGHRLTTSCGSPHYAAPEVIQGTPYEGELADVWSAGVVLFAMIARRLPFDNRDVPELLRTIKEGHYEMDPAIEEGSYERDLVERSLKKDPSERFTLKQISMHPYCFATVYVLDRRFHDYLAEIVTAQEMEEDADRKRTEANFEDVENLELPVLASLGIVLKVSTLDEVKDMLRHDRNHARVFYSKLLEFRNCHRPPISPLIQKAYFETNHFGELRYDDHDDDSMDLSVTPSQFPDPPRPRTPSFLAFDPDHLDSDRTPPNWTHQPRASIPDAHLLHDVAQVDPFLRSAPPQTQKFPSSVVCLHEFGPVASAPPQIESFLTEALPLSPRIKEAISRRNSVVTVDEDNLPFLNLEDSPVSPKSTPYPILHDDSSSPSIQLAIEVRKRTMHQRIRSLLSATSAPLPPSTSSPRVSTTRTRVHARPPSPTPSTASSRLTRSSAYRSLGRALLGKGPKSPALLPCSSNSAEELSYAEQIVLETLVPTFSPIPPLAPVVRAKGKGKAGSESGGQGGDRSFASVSFLDPVTLGDGTGTVKKTSTIKKKLSLGMLQFFHDESPPNSVNSTTSQASSKALTSSSSPTTATKLTKEKRRPKALSIASSNHLIPAPPPRSPSPATTSLVKKLSLLGFGTSSAHQASPSISSDPILLATPSPLTLEFPATRTASPGSLDSSLHVRSITSVNARSPTLNPPSRPTSVFVRQPIPTILRRRSTLSSPLSATIDPSPSPSTASSVLHSPPDRRFAATATRLEQEKLEFENRLLTSRLKAMEEELERMRQREKEWLAIVTDAVGTARESRGSRARDKVVEAATFGSKTNFEDEGEAVNGTDEQQRWIESLEELERGFTGV